MRPPLPFAAGGEVAGYVKGVGSGVNRFKVDDRVIAFCGYAGFASEVAVKVCSIPDLMLYRMASLLLYQCISANGNAYAYFWLTHSKFATGYKLTVDVSQQNVPVHVLHNSKRVCTLYHPAWTL
jgi:Zn-dependent alcohol dehydrogenase